MKNRKLLLIVSLVLALTMSLGGTLAYLTDTDAAVNVMTLGNVDIEQLENGKEEDGFENFQPLYPAYYTADDYNKATDVVGKLDKKVTVKNVGTSDAYVRTVIAFEAGDLSKADFEKYIHATFATNPVWIEGAVEIAGVKYYIANVTYPEKLAAKAESAASLVDVAMDKTATNEIVAKFGDTYEILVVTQACQTINMPENANEALNIAFGPLSSESHPWSDWNGTSNEPAGNIIASKADLLALSGKNIEGTYTLMANIDMGGEELKTIGVTWGKSLVFNGNGYTISNVKLVTGNQDTMTNIGLFFVHTNSTLTVNKLTIKNAEAEGTNEYSTGVAAVVGYANGGSTVTLNNVDVVNAQMKNEHSNAALLIGYTVGKVNLTDCDVTGTAVGEKANKQGAYIGTANTADCVVTITNCTNGTAIGDIGRVINGATETGAATFVTTAAELANAVAAGKTNIKLADGEYDVYGCAGKTLTISGSKNAVIKIMNEGEEGCDYGFDGANVTFNGVTFDTSENNGSYKGFARMSATFNDCAFTGAYTTHHVQTFNNCEFDFKNGYLWTWGGNSATFNNCTFNGNSKCILAHGYASTVITINDCKFAATEKGYASNGTVWTAAVEIDPAGSNTYTINFTGNNTKTDSYAGWTRVKDDSTGHTITGLN